MLTETHTTGISSVSVSRTSKGDYTYDIKIYHSGKGRAPFAAINRVDEMRKDLEKRLGIAGCPVEGEEAAPGTVCPLAPKIAAALGKIEEAEGLAKRVAEGMKLIESHVTEAKTQREKAADDKKKGSAPKKTE